MKTKKEMQPTKPKAIFAYLYKQVKHGNLDIQEYLEGHIQRDDYKKAKLIDFLIDIKTYDVASEDILDDGHYYLGITTSNRAGDQCAASVIEFVKNDGRWKIDNVLFPVELEVNPEFQIIIHDDETCYAKELVGLFDEFDEVLCINTKIKKTIS
jgi:hypothetical protein